MRIYVIRFTSQSPDVKPASHKPGKARGNAIIAILRIVILIETLLVIVIRVIIIIVVVTLP